METIKALKVKMLSGFLQKKISNLHSRGFLTCILENSQLRKSKCSDSNGFCLLCGVGQGIVTVQPSVLLCMKWAR